MAHGQDWITMFSMDDRSQLKIGHALVHRLARDREGRFWAASSAGAYRWSPDTNDRNSWFGEMLFFNKGEKENSLPGNEVLDLVIQGDTVWLAIKDGGLAYIHQDRVHAHAPLDRDLGGVLGLTTDITGKVWMTTTKGVEQFDPATGEFLHWPLGRPIRPGSAIAHLSNGNIALAAENSLIIFNISDHAPLPELPIPYLSSMNIAGEQAPVRTIRNPIELSYRNSTLELGISAMFHGGVAPLSFLYKLEGMVGDWSETKAGDPLGFTALPPGDHRLLVRVRDAHGRTGDVHDLLLIIIPAPFWQTWWFYALIAAAVSAGIYTWSRIRMAQAMKLQMIRDRIASDLHDEVGSSLSSITIGSQLAMKLGNGQSEQVRNILTRIGNTSSESLRSMSDIVWAIDPRNDEGDALLDRMRRIANELLESKGVDTTFSIGQGIDDLRLSMNARKELLLLYKEAIHNASKYAGAERVIIAMRREKGGLILTIEDEGKGFDLSLHPDGHGLESMRRRAAKLGSHLRLESAPGKGTRVEVRVDLAKIRE